jgi:hypothetical protein
VTCRNIGRRNERIEAKQSKSIPRHITNILCNNTNLKFITLYREVDHSRHDPTMNHLVYP